MLGADLVEQRRELRRQVALGASCADAELPDHLRDTLRVNLAAALSPVPLADFLKYLRGGYDERVLVYS